MAFAGIFISHIEKIIHGTFNLATLEDQQQQQQQQQQQLVAVSLYDDISGSVNSILACDNSNECTEANYPGVLDSELTSLTTAQRHIFIVILAILFVLSMFGNICTLFVNFRRKIRPFFRACLISLAFSDLMNTVFLATSYLSQFTADYVQIWNLGDVLCSLIPFATTCAILASSMTLVGIAVDRYIAVMKAAIGFWNPSVISCIACMLCIWLASISIACPVFTFYNLIPVYILTKEYENITETARPAMNTTSTSLWTVENGFVRITPKRPFIEMAANSTSSTMPITKSSVEELSYVLVHKDKLVSMCVAKQENVSVYYVIVFSIIFVPCIVAFFWFNSIIARKLWKRRHIGAINKQRNLDSENKTKQNTIISSSTIEIPKRKYPNSQSDLANTVRESTTKSLKPAGNDSREARHLRMFTIILLMMAVFLFLRLPAWIFLLMRMYGKYTKSSCWNLYFVFGLMNLASSVLNPLFYTFLTETIQYALKVKAKVSSLFCGCYCQRCCCCCYRGKYAGSNEPAASCSALDNKHVCSSNVQLEDIEELSCKTKSCYETLSICLKPKYKYDVQMHSLQPDDSKRYKKEGTIQSTNNDRDEGVDFNDERDEKHVDRIYGHNQEVYTIFAPTIMSKTINKQTFK